MRLRQSSLFTMTMLILIHSPFGFSQKWQLEKNQPKPGSEHVVAEMSFSWIPPGTFQMGSALSPTEIQDRYGIPETAAHADGWSNQLPRHQVQIEAGFWLARHEVTVASFRRFQLESGYQTEAEIEGWSFGHGPKGFGKLKDVNWRNPGWTIKDNQPVCAISWNDVHAYIDWLSNQVDGHFRLPTEAEWEYAARAGTIGAFFWGDETADHARYANVLDQYFGGDDGYRFVAPVGSFQPNAWGLHDMVGNVWEWCQSHYRDSYAPDSKLTEERVDRGGGWDSPPFNARIANRGAATAGFRSVNLGFRLVFEANEKENL